MPGMGKYRISSSVITVPDRYCEVLVPPVRLYSIYGYRYAKCRHRTNIKLFPGSVFMRTTQLFLKRDQICQYTVWSSLLVQARNPVVKSLDRPQASRPANAYFVRDIMQKDVRRCKVQLMCPRLAKWSSRQRHPQLGLCAHLLDH